MTTSRTCTIVFTDLVGSTELRTRLGDDAFDTRRRAHDRLVTELVGRHNGELVKHEGDGVMVVFASAADALSCGVAIQQGISRDRMRDDAQFILRVGASAGDVSEEDGDFHGTPVVEAARLCDAASGDQILVADVVRVLAGSRGGHQFVPLGALELKGLAEPLVAWDVVWTRPEGRVEIPARLGEVAARGACVGRDNELETIITEWKRATTGERRLVLVAGEPGIGKTRLAAELAARVVSHGGIALHGWCDEDLGSPYQPWVQGLGAFVRATTDDDLEESLSGIAPDVARLVPEVAERLPLETTPVAIDAEAERARMFDAVDALVERVSARRPLLFVLDDVHWADRPTLGLMRRLLQSDRPGAVLFLATYRDTDVDRRHPLGEILADLRREPRATRVSLAGLDEAGLAALLSDRAGHDAPPQFVRLLLNETEGNPFFIEEVLLHLVESGSIYQRDGVWVSDLAAEDLGLPEGVRDVVGRRLSRLSPSANDLLNVAAVVGREFDLAPVIAVSDLDRNAALDAIDAAIQTGLVVEVAQTAGRYSFSHALVRQTLLEEISSARRVRLHWKVGEALQATGRASLPTIAFHLCEGVLAGDVARAADAAIAAAENAYAMAAPVEVRSMAQRAMSVLDDAGADEPQLRCRALLLLAEASGTLNIDIDIARTRVLEAADIAQRHRWPELVTRAALAYNMMTTPGAADRTATELALAALELGADDADRAELLSIVGYQKIVSGFVADGLAMVDEAVAAAKTDRGRAISLLFRAQSDWGSPDRELLLRGAERAMSAAEAYGSVLWVSLAHSGRAYALLCAGDLVGFARERDTIAEIRSDAKSPVVGTIDAALALIDGRLADAEVLTIDVLGTFDPASFSWLNATAQLAAVLYWSGRDDELIPALGAFPVADLPQKHVVDSVRISARARRDERDEQLDAFAVDGFSSIPENFHRPGSLCHLGSAVAWLGDRELAAQLLPLLEPYAGGMLVAPPGSLVFDAADSVRGMLLAVLDRVDEAIACFEAAAVLVERDVPHAVMNAHRLASALETRAGVGDRDRARELATSALERASQVGMAPDVRFAQAVLEALG